MIIEEGTQTRKQPCASCPFNENGGLELSEGRLMEIKCYLVNGQNHFCHSDQSNRTICRGGRRYQLTKWHEMGWIDAPTEESLRKAMRACGIEPRLHV